MKCPNCGAPAAEEAADCEKCGVVFAKWDKLRELKKRDESAARAELESGGSSSFNPWLGRAIASGLVALWLVVLGAYFHYHKARAHKKPLGPLTGETAELRDPVTGEIRQVPIRRGPGIKAP
ncbi:MAG: hypothetical protein ACHQ51_11145 [Elusimicrobiota bacterium]